MFNFAHHQHQGPLFQEEWVPDDGLSRENRTTWSVAGSRHCHEAGINVTLPEPLTSGAKSEGRFGKKGFVYLPEEDAYRCPAGECLPYRGQGTILQFTLPAGTDSAT